MGPRFRVCRVDEVVEGEPRGFAVDGLLEPVVVTRDGGRLVAFAGMCPHGDVSLETGELVAGQIVCPGHGYAFDLTSGRCAHDRRMRLGLFHVEVVGDDVFVELVGPRR